MFNNKIIFLVSFGDMSMGFYINLYLKPLCPSLEEMGEGRLKVGSMEKVMSS